MSNWLPVLEAAYELGGDEETWLSRVLVAAMPLMPATARRAYAVTYDARDPSAMRFETIVTWNFPAGTGRLRTVLGGPPGTDPAHNDEVEAFMGAEGEMECAASDRVEVARARLVEAVRGLNRARDRARSRPAEALEGWRAMVQARWSLVDQFESDGKRYLVAVRNEAEPSLKAFPFMETLTLRERQVLGFALLGHSTKVAAYELGISPSTFRVLLARGLSRLGYRSVAELMKAVTPV
jgi:DNA-binding CsgD family transcriptional regulator